MPDWMEPFARTIDAAKKYVVSSTLDRVDWDRGARLGRGGVAVRAEKPGDVIASRYGFLPTEGVPSTTS
jgi:hypothetical protein